MDSAWVLFHGLQLWKRKMQGCGAGKGRDAPAAEGLLAGGEPGAWSLVVLFQSP